MHFGNIINTFWEMRDKRVDGWPLMDSPYLTFYLMGMYLLTCRVVGPLLMKNLKPFELRTPLIIFNLVMVLINIYFCYKFWILTWGNDYNWYCTPVDRSSNFRSLEIVKFSYYYYIVKFIDWTDTMFFILRKKFSHLTILHVYHHTVMPLMGWLVTRFTPGGQNMLTPLVNSGVHVVMHLYYLLAALGPRYQKYVWWKRYVTLIQLVQFVVLVIHGVLPIFLSNCNLNFPSEWNYFFASQGVMILVLFLRFYSQSYRRHKTAETTIKVKFS